MTTAQINSIDQVILLLDEIIAETENNNDSLGYFAALYRKVTTKVKEGIHNNFFDNGPRMEKLDIVFAMRYIDAYYSWREKQQVTGSWQKAFGLSNNYWPVVLQHLLMGMNAHINLDLGIAAAEVSKHHIDDLKNDFNKINQILSSLVIEVQNDLAAIWPTLGKILRLTNKADDFLVDFSMKLARDGAWEFAQIIAATPEYEIENVISKRDMKVAKKTRIILYPGFVAGLLFKIIRLGEKGAVKERIRQLAN